MASGRRSPVRALLQIAVLSFACAASTACESLGLTGGPPGPVLSVGSFHFTGNGIYAGFVRWLPTVPPKDRAVLDKLIASDDLVVHLILKVGYLDPDKSRGGASSLASAPLAKGACFWHPRVEGVPPERDWDLIYDRELTEKFENRYGIPTPPEVVFQHELFGHILLILNDPELLKSEAALPLEEATEPGAVEIENQYRRILELREVPPGLVGVSPP